MITEVNKPAWQVPLVQTLLVVMMLVVPAGVHAETADPYENWNRKSFAVNEFFDRILLKPVARGYTKVVPRFARRGIHNAFVNFGTPVVALNQLLQGKGVRALSDTGRFAVNTTLGIGGLFDPATGMGLVAHNEDFGQTLQTWGVRPGSHIVLPLRGSTTVTDAVGTLISSFVNPTLLFSDTQTRLIITGVSIVDVRAELLGAETLVSGDKYLFLRDASLQRRQFLVNDGEVVDDPFLSDDFDDFDEEEDDDWEVE